MKSLTTTLVILLLSVTLSAAFEFGEKVEFRWSKEWREGTITEIREDKRMKISCTLNGQPKIMTLPPTSVRTINRTGDPNDFRAGDKVLLEQKGKWLDATVLEDKGNGVEVAFVIDGTTLSPVVSKDRLKHVGATNAPKPTTISSKDFRSWKSTSGTEIEARLAEYVGGSAEVTLERRNGKQMKVRLDQLSVTDKAYLTRSLKGMPVN